MTGYICGYILAAVWVAFITAGLLSACTPEQQQRAVVDGQLFCSIATKAGPLVVALVDATGTPVIVAGLAASTVSSICGIISAIPVPPPPMDVGAVPIVSVPLSATPTH